MSSPRNDAIAGTAYHACRCAYNAAEAGVPWYEMVHVLREGLGMTELVTCPLTEAEKDRHAELLQYLRTLGG